MDRAMLALATIDIFYRQEEEATASYKEEGLSLVIYFDL